LYYDKNSKLVQSLLKAYRSIVDDQRDMIAIGGGTYAKSMNNIIAFGCAFNEEENHIHDANESLSIEEFKKQVEIYIEAIKNLNEA
ncbi:MAG: M20/M25/M40 family metallo-hydrolase, partial [Erysipelotrichaceae bacterium]|nr:M20/M25/M40 family metallo-hydrolase [Erysipelotrichaceae bacterium]